MKIKEIKENIKNIYLNVEIVDIEEIRTIESTGDKVCDVKVKDETGEAQSSIFGEENLSQLKEAKVGDRLVIKSFLARGNYNELVRITSGRYGKIEVVKS